ncbi:MAG TPA: antibiotic biosynthesis monooxygenase [Rhizomicrobium sp.]|nr:antibiotic biosynthesis monooxygenase [Rhizomicrobium sp.]
MQSAISPYYRVNKFIVPKDSRDAFLSLIATTHGVVRRQPGFVRDLVLEQQSGPGQFNFVTLLEFSGIEVVPQITQALADFDAQTGVDRKAVAMELGVKSDMANYRPLPMPL